MSAAASIISGSTPLLSDYDSFRDGPLFAVSDEGSAGAAVVEAGYASAKAIARAGTPLRLGVILDGERMTSAGETPIGPPEYRALRAVAAGRLLLTTNVGTRANVRLAGQLPEFAADPASLDTIAAAFQPFVQAPGGHLRPLTVRLRLPQGTKFAGLAGLLEGIGTLRTDRRIGPRELHRLSLLAKFSDPITSEFQLQQIEAAIVAAAANGLDEVTISGPPSAYAEARISAPGLLECLELSSLERLLRFARERGVCLAAHRIVDVEATARTIWTGLEAARAGGFDGGKYGLFPMTLEEQKQVIERLTRWLPGWTPIPAFYVDTPLVTKNEVYGVDRCEEAARHWLKVARGAGATLALFDAPDRITPRKLVASKPGEGALNLEQIERLTRYGELLGIRILWSGGITAPQALELARARVFAIFSTSSTAIKVAVSAPFTADPRMSSENEPETDGIRRIHAIIQAGFLASRLESLDGPLASRLLKQGNALAVGKRDAAALAMLNDDLVQAWRKLDASEAPPLLPSPLRRPRPVPADAVRVFRGRRHSGTSHEGFVDRLESVFMPMTVQMQRLYGLTAYLPAVLPESDDEALPDEIALVFYRTQEAYHEAKRCIGGRAYSELHELAFDMAASRSGFPVLFGTGDLLHDQPYHLFEGSIDWQSGSTRLFAGRRKPGLAAGDFLAAVEEAVRAVRERPDPLDAAVFLATDAMLIWWDHSPAAEERQVHFFDAIADKVFAGAPRPLHIPTDLTEPYAGLSLDRFGDFLNFQFSQL